METLGTRVKRLRESLGLSQFELARSANITQPTLSRLEGNKMFQLKSRNLISLARALKVSMDYLSGMEENMKPQDLIDRDGEARELIIMYGSLEAQRRRELRDFARFLTGE